MRSAIVALLLLGSGLPARSASPAVPADLPREQIAGPFASGHVQGIAVDRKGGFIYYSFTDMLAKYDFEGRLVGTLTGWSGHLGDLDFNPVDGRVYGSLEYGKQDAFYIAMIDGARIDRVGMTVAGTDLLRAVYLPEVTRDYAADLDGDGKADHRYGCSGIDGVAFGPAFGRSDGPLYLTVAYGIYGDVARSDNDHQVLLQYDATDWGREAQPIDEQALHHSGPTTPRGKYFVLTGNTRYGVQNLAYDSSLQRWFMGVYQGAKPDWPNYLLFALDARSRPRRQALQGLASPQGMNPEKGLLLPLAQDGIHDVKTGVRGWYQKADVGIQPLGDGLYYLVQNDGVRGAQSAVTRLMHWTGASSKPFETMPMADR